MGTGSQTRRAFVASLFALALCGCAAPKPKSPKSVQRPKKDVRPTDFLEELELSKRQRDQVDQLVAELRESFAAYDQTRIVLLDAVLLQIKRGKIDEEVLLPLAKNAVRAFERGRPALFRILDRFHALMKSQQRQDFVALWDADDDAELTEDQKRAAREAQIGRVLDLTAGQKAQLYPALVIIALRYWGTISSMRSNLRDAKDAFVGEDFHASKLEFFRDLDLMEVAEMISDSLKSALSILEPSQRTTLAAYLDARLR